MQQQEIVAAFPNPPPFYKLYLILFLAIIIERIALIYHFMLFILMEDRYANYKSDGIYPSGEKAPPLPPAPPEGTYRMFGLTYTVFHYYY